MTPSEINDLVLQIEEEKNNEVAMTKAKLEATMHAVTLGIANLKKKGKKYELFEKEVVHQAKRITKEEKQKELEYLERTVL